MLTPHGVSARYMYVHYGTGGGGGELYHRRVSPPVDRSSTPPLASSNIVNLASCNSRYLPYFARDFLRWFLWSGTPRTVKL